MDEVVFFHRPSGTAIVADLIQTFSDHFLREHWMVSIPCAPRRPHAGPGRRALRMETIVHQSRAGTAGASEGTQLELSARHRGAW
jgi:hypothetical protein